MTKNTLLGTLILAAVGFSANALAAEPATSQDKTPTRAQQLMGDIAPKMAELTDDVLLGDIWKRPGLSMRDRSLVTISALVAMNRPEQLRSHIRLGLQNGLKQDEIIEAITQLAFYSGWPNAISAISEARTVFKDK